MTWLHFNSNSCTMLYSQTKWEMISRRWKGKYESSAKSLKFKWHQEEKVRFNMFMSILLDPTQQAIYISKSEIKWWCTELHGAVLLFQVLSFTAGNWCLWSNAREKLQFSKSKCVLTFSKLCFITSPLKNRGKKWLLNSIPMLPVWLLFALFRHFMAWSFVNV